MKMSGFDKGTLTGAYVATIDGTGGHGFAGKEEARSLALRQMDVRHRWMRRLALNGLFIAMAMVLSIAERWIPLTALVPIPGIKIGLANIVTLFILFHFSWVDAAVVSLLRCILAALMFGGMSSLMFSLSGAALALPAMMLIRLGYPRWFSLVGVSMAGAAAHNLGQLCMAAVVMKNLAVFAYLPVLFGSSLVMGTLTALAAYPFFRAMSRTGLTAKR